MAKISVSLDDELAAELRDSAGENVSAFVAGTIRRQLDRQRLKAFLDELEDELGPPTDEEMAQAAAAFDRVQPANRKPKAKAKSPRPAKTAAERRR